MFQIALQRGRTSVLPCETASSLTLAPIAGVIFIFAGLVTNGCILQALGYQWICRWAVCFLFVVSCLFLSFAHFIMPDSSVLIGPEKKQFSGAYILCGLCLIPLYKCLNFGISGEHPLKRKKVMKRNDTNSNTDIRESWTPRATDLPSFLLHVK